MADSSSAQDPIRPWPLKTSRRVGDFRIFTIRSDVKTSPRTGKDHDFFVIDSVPWVNVVAVTPDARLVMIEQYRHGSNTVELEVPGGMMDPQENSPLEAGLRELREETGFEGSGQVIGKIWSNPAIMSNRTYTVLVENCELKHEVSWDSGEDLVTRLIPVQEIPSLVRAGRIGHSLVAVALFHFTLWARENMPQWGL
jgi:8-oxo-dGTP pyrophosphatase MutT (NUDIX family)